MDGLDGLPAQLDTTDPSDQVTPGARSPVQVLQAIDPRGPASQVEARVASPDQSEEVRVVRQGVQEAPRPREGRGAAEEATDAGDPRGHGGSEVHITPWASGFEDSP